MEQQVPPAEGAIAVSGITVPEQDDFDNWVFSIFGEGFDPGTIVFVNSPSVPTTVEFFSDNRIDATVSPSDWGKLGEGSHGVTVTTGAGETITVGNLFTIDSSGGVSVAMKRAPLAAKAGLKKPAAARSGSLAAKGRPAIGKKVAPGKPVPSTKPTGAKPAIPTKPGAAALSDDEKKELSKHPLWDKIKHLF